MNSGNKQTLVNTIETLEEFAEQYKLQPLIFASSFFFSYNTGSVPVLLQWAGMESCVFSLIQYFSFLRPTFFIKSTLPVSSYSPVVTNIAFSVNLNRLTLKQSNAQWHGGVRRAPMRCPKLTHAHAHAGLERKPNEYWQTNSLCQNLYKAKSRM